FSQVPRRPPSLPSFPTRRSSDLVTDHAGRAPGRVDDTGSDVAVFYSLHVLEELRRGEYRAQRRAQIVAQHANEDFLRLLHVLVEDRKSTRLNSSHVKISYAVFCL